MKRLIVILSAFFITISASAQSKQQVSFKVWGNCGMCEKTIENAAKLSGVTEADWDKSTKMMKVVYDPAKVKLQTIKEKIAEKGYDTDQVKASDEAYSKLHSCCRYERAEANNKLEAKGRCCGQCSPDEKKASKVGESTNNTPAKSCCNKKS